MTKDIKRYYHFLDLPYDATIEDVQSRQKVMIKVLRAKAIKRGVSYKKKINKIAVIGEEVINYIKGYGVQPPEKILFDTKTSDLLTQIFLLVIIGTVSVVSIIALL